LVEGQQSKSLHGVGDILHLSIIAHRLAAATGPKILRMADGERDLRSFV